MEQDEAQPGCGCFGSRKKSNKKPQVVTASVTSTSADKAGTGGKQAGWETISLDGDNPKPTQLSIPAGKSTASPPASSPAASTLLPNTKPPAQQASSPAGPPPASSTTPPVPATASQVSDKVTHRNKPGAVATPTPQPELVLPPTQPPTQPNSQPLTAAEETTSDVRLSLESWSAPSKAAADTTAMPVSATVAEEANFLAAQLESPETIVTTAQIPATVPAQPASDTPTPQFEEIDISPEASSAAAEPKDKAAMPSSEAITITPFSTAAAPAAMLAITPETVDVTPDAVAITLQTVDTTDAVDITPETVDITPETVDITPLRTANTASKIPSAPASRAASQELSKLDSSSRQASQDVPLELQAVMQNLLPTLTPPASPTAPGGQTPITIVNISVNHYTANYKLQPDGSWGAPEVSPTGSPRSASQPVVVEVSGGKSKLSPRAISGKRPAPLIQAAPAAPSKPAFNTIKTRSTDSFGPAPPVPAPKRLGGAPKKPALTNG